MTLREISRINYELDLTGFEGVEFTESSKGHLSWPAAVRFAADRHSVLQSALDAAAFRVEANGVDGANDYQATRAYVAYFKEGNTFRAAIGDTVNDYNVVLVRAQEGYDSHGQAGRFLMPKKSLAFFISHAELSDRILEVPEQNRQELATEQIEGKSAFGQYAWNKAILGDVAEPFAAMLHKRGHFKGHVYTCTPQTLEKIGVGGDLAEVRPVFLGYDGFHAVNADLQFNFVIGRARGIRYPKKV